jgi:CubicO group peptidase (beta-lactamase class C family)
MTARCTWTRLAPLVGLLLVRAAIAESPIAEALAPARASAVEAAVEAELARQEIVGLSLGIVQKGRIVFLKGYGLADREQSTPVTTDTVFNWASNSKPVAGVLAMQLVEQHKLDLDADVRTYVPEFPEKTVVITCRELLCHQSGLPHYKNGDVIGTERTYDTDLPFLDPIVSLDKFNQSPLIFQPRERCEYSSHAYVLLSAAIQKAGGQPYAEQLQSRICTPLEITSLQLDLPRSDPLWAAGYNREGEGAIERVPDEVEYWKHGAGGYKSNIVDFARWASALVNHRLVSPETERIMWTPQATADGEITKYGLGFGVAHEGERLIVSHNGGQPDVRTRMELHPDERAAVVALCNCQYADINAVTAAVFRALE